MIKLFERKIWPPDFSKPPWGSAPSIFEHIQKHIDQEKMAGLSDEGYRLPDEPNEDPNSVSFAPGALDGIFGHHGSDKSEEQLVSELYLSLEQATMNASEKNINTLYKLIKDNSAIEVIDRLIDHIQIMQGLDAERLSALMHWFATKCSDREAVKVSMALLGFVHGPDNSDIFLTLGRHDEFTLYSAVAIASNETYGEDVLLQLAKSTEGWGRINTVERLSDTTDPEVKDWLLRQGYKNDVMYEYLACICARAGDLHLRLQADKIDDDLFNAACEIVEALISGEGGPAEGLADYEHGCDVIASLLRHGKDRFFTVSHFGLLKSIKSRINDYLSGEHDLQQDWSKVGAESILSDLSELLTKASWKDVVLEALRGGDRQAFWDASRNCVAFDIDPWPYFFERCEAGEDYWWDLMRTSDTGRVDQVLELGRKQISFDQIATGPGRELGLGADYAHHNKLEWILQDLGRFPGKGWDFIAVGLQSPVVRNRNMALNALDNWGKENWPDEVLLALSKLERLEPMEDIKIRISDLLEVR